MALIEANEALVGPTYNLLRKGPAIATLTIYAHHSTVDEQGRAVEFPGAVLDEKTFDCTLLSWPNIKDEKSLGVKGIYRIARGGIITDEYAGLHVGFYNIEGSRRTVFRELILDCLEVQ